MITVFFMIKVMIVKKMKEWITKMITLLLRCVGNKNNTNGKYKSVNNNHNDNNSNNNNN